MQFVVKKEHFGLRLDVFIAMVCPKPSLSRAQARKLCLEQQVLVNSRPSKPGYQLKAGENVVLVLDEVRQAELELKVVYEDDSLVVIEKPRAIHSAAHFNSKEPSIELALAGSLASKHPEIGLVNRLDFWTSGLLMAGKTTVDQEELRKLLKTGKVPKSYVAWVSGVFRDKQEIVTGIDAENKKKVRVTSSGNPATSLIEPLAVDSSQSSSLVKISGLSMQRHQVRLHCAHIGHPLVGDEIYGEPERGQGFFLHATKIEINSSLTVNSDCWKEWSDLPQELREF